MSRCRRWNKPSTYNSFMCPCKAFSICFDWIPIYFCVTAALECCRSWRTSSILYPLFIYIWVAKYFRKLCVEIPDNPIYSQAAFKCFYICRSDKSKSCCCSLMRFLMRYWSINSLISSGTVNVRALPVLISKRYRSPSLIMSQ